MCLELFEARNLALCVVCRCLHVPLPQLALVSQSRKRFCYEVIQILCHSASLLQVGLEILEKDCWYVWTEQPIKTPLPPVLPQKLRLPKFMDAHKSLTTGIADQKKKWRNPACLLSEGQCMTQAVEMVQMFQPYTAWKWMSLSHSWRNIVIIKQTTCNHTNTAFKTQRYSDWTLCRQILWYRANHGTPASNVTYVR